MNDEKKKYRRSTEDTRAAKAIAESFSEQLQEMLHESMEELKNTVDERLGKLEERLEALEENLEGHFEGIEGWDPDGFAAQLDEIEDTLKDPILRACLRGTA